MAYPDIEPREIRVATFINVHEWTFRQVVFVFYVSIGNLILVNYVQRYYFSIKSARKSRKNLQIEIYLVGTGSRCVGDGFHHINSLIIYYGIRGALT